MVLSSGGFTFTSDKRVRVTHGPEGGDPDDWLLAIDPVMERDSGLYECQVNTRPDKMSLVFKINVMREYLRTKLLCKLFIFLQETFYGAEGENRKGSLLNPLAAMPANALNPAVGNKYLCRRIVRSGCTQSFGVRVGHHEPCPFAMT